MVIRRSPFAKSYWSYADGKTLRGGPAAETASAQGAGWLELRALRSLASRFPDQTLREQLGALIETIPSGHDLPAFRAATGLLSESG